MDQKETQWELIFTIFKCKNEFAKELGLKRKKNKMRSLVLFHISFMSYGPEFLKNSVLFST